MRDVGLRLARRCTTAVSRNSRMVAQQAASWSVWKTVTAGNLFVCFNSTRKAFACSTFVHTVIGCTLALIVVAKQPPGSAFVLDVQFNSDEDEASPLELTSTEIQMDSPARGIESLPVALTASFVAVGTELAETDVSVPVVPGRELPAVDVAEALNSVAHSRRGRRHGGTAELGDAGDGGQNGTGTSGTSSFFGNEIKAASVAFVIDASTSMSGSRFLRARMELVNSLKHLKPEQQFFVLFYTHETFPQFFPNSKIKLINADEKAVKSIISWIDNSRPRGGTQPQEAMAISLGLKPEAIFFLSDGEIPIETLQVVQQYNRGTQIHTIAFGSSIGGEVMQHLAQNSGGTYQFIPN